MAETSDLAAIIGCEDQAFRLPVRRDNSRNVSPDGELASQIRNETVHVIADTEGVLGYISFAPNFDHLYVRTIAVLPEYHQLGIGSQLLDFAEQQASELGLGSVRLFTDGMMPGNLIFYERRGYEETGRCIEGDFSRVFYSKSISASAECRAGRSLPQ